MSRCIVFYQQKIVSTSFPSVTNVNAVLLIKFMVQRLRPQIKAAIFLSMHFSRHISQSHSTFSLLAALKLRSRAN